MLVSLTFPKDLRSMSEQQVGPLLPLTVTGVRANLNAVRHEVDA